MFEKYSSRVTSSAYVALPLKLTEIQRDDILLSPYIHKEFVAIKF